jgi:hypothetical protein
LITPKNGAIIQMAANHHGAIIQNNNNRNLDQMIKKSTINSGRARGMNSTTLRHEGNGSNAGRLILKKAISPQLD